MTDPTRQVTVMPGVPNMPGLTLDGGVVPFPDTTTDFVKVLQERGITAKFAVPRESRRYVGHKAFEVWLPILEFTRDVLIGLEAGLLVELIKTYLAPRATRSDATELDQGAAPEVAKPAILRVEWHVARPDGGRESFVANGSAGHVIEALTQFERRIRGE
jgi:hypothetical protein